MEYLDHPMHFHQCGEESEEDEGDEKDEDQ